MRKYRELTQEEFERLLAWLAPEREKAGEQFLLLRERVSRIFMSRGCHEAEEVFYEAIRRVAQKPPAHFAEYDGEPGKYVLGVANKVFLEWIARQPTWGEFPRNMPVHRNEDGEMRLACQESCLQQLAPQERALLEQYFQGQGQSRIDARKLLAKEIRLTENALRLRISRLRQVVMECLEDCLQQK